MLRCRSKNTYRLLGATLTLALATSACGDDAAASTPVFPPTPLGDGGSPVDAATTGTTGSIPFNPATDSGLPGLPGDTGRTDGGLDGPDASSPPPEPTWPGLAGTDLEPMETTGAPIDAAPLSWKYLEFDGAYCRDGSAAGLSVNLNPDSDRVMIFFEGGGACFDDVTCLANPANIDAASEQEGRSEGIFNREDDRNPFKDWNFVYLPYCTGDVFAGTNPNGMIGSAAQKFVGYLNTQLFLDRVAPTFPSASDVVVTGVSAGGFGSSSNVVQIQRAFPNVLVKLLDDSGPPMGGDYLTPCLQEIWRDTWGLDGSLLAECGDHCPDKTEFVADYGVYLASTFQNRLSGLIESTEDSIIAGFFGAGTDPFGLGPCTGIPLATPVPGDQFRQGLIEFRKSVSEYENFGTFYPEGTTHTWLSAPRFYEVEAGGMPLVDWVRDLVEDVGVSHQGS